MQESETYVFPYQSNVDKTLKFMSSIDPIDLIAERNYESPSMWNKTKMSPNLTPESFDPNDFSTPSSSSNILDPIVNVDRDDLDISIESISSSTNSKFEFSSNLFETLAPKYRFDENDEDFDENDEDFDNPDKKSNQIFNEDLCELEEDSNFDKNSSISAISRTSARRKTSLTCRSYKDLLQRGLQVDGTAFVSSVAEKFLYQPSSSTSKEPDDHNKLPKKRVRKRRRTLLETCESLASTSNNPVESDSEFDSQAVNLEIPSSCSEDIKFYPMDQQKNMTENSLENFPNDARVGTERSKTCMMCEEDEEVISYQYCPSLFLCPVCGEPYEKWFQEPWKYANFRCKSKHLGLICRAYDCFACWFWKCVNFVRRENIRLWARVASPYVVPMDDDLNDGSSNYLTEDQCSSDTCATSSSMTPRYKPPKSLSVRPFDLGSTEDGPRVRYVCRRQSVVTGQMSPKSLKDSPKTKFLLSALPRKMKKELVNDRYKAVKFGGRNKLVLKLERQYLNNLDGSSAAIKEETGKTLDNSTKRRKIRRCGVCVGCKAENCGICSNCRDMPKFGGLGVLKAACRERQCEFITLAHANDKKQKRKRQNISTVSVQRNDADDDKLEETDELIV